MTSSFFDIDVSAISMLLFSPCVLLYDDTVSVLETGASLHFVVGGKGNIG